MNGTIYFDGGARPNAGSAGCAAIIRRDDGFVQIVGSYLGIATNNVAEWNGLILGLRTARNLGIKRLDIFGDSKLVIEQFLGRWQVNVPALASLRAEASNIARDFDELNLKHIPREQNEAADAVCTEVIMGGADIVHPALARHIIYLAGPIAGAEDAESWRADAKIRLARLDLAYRCPIEANAQYRDVEMTDEVAESIVNVDLGLVAESDALLVHYPYHTHGTACEMFTARHLQNKPVVVFGWPDMARIPTQGKMSAFLKRNVDVFCDDLPSAIRALADILGIPACNYCSSRDHLNDGRICQHGKPWNCCDGLHFSDIAQAV